jgi:hypothetical protein
MGKTIGMRIGTFRTSTHIPSGRVEGRDITLAKPLDDNAMQYLGMFLGASEQVQRAWMKRTTERVKDKSYRWAKRSMPSTREGRCIALQNSILAQVWYLVDNQVIEGMDLRMEEWRQATWDFMAG